MSIRALRSLSTASSLSLLLCALVGCPASPQGSAKDTGAASARGVKPGVKRGDPSKVRIEADPEEGIVSTRSTSGAPDGAAPKVSLEPSAEAPVPATILRGDPPTLDAAEGEVTTGELPAAKVEVRRLAAAAAQIRGLTTQGDHLYWVESTRDQLGAEHSRILRVSLVDPQPAPVVLVEGLGRVEDLTLSASELLWLEMARDPAPGAGEGMGPRVRRRAIEGAAEIQDVGPLEAGSHGLEWSAGRVAWVLPVKARGALGGFASMPATGGEVTTHARDLGPTFVLARRGEGWFFTAHRVGEPDLVYELPSPSLDASGASTVERRLVAERGLVAVQYEGDTLVWTRIALEGRGCEVGRLAPGATPETLLRVRGHLYDTLAIDGDIVWLGSAPADDTGEILRVDARTKQVARALAAGRVWQLIDGPRGPIAVVEGHEGSAPGERVLLSIVDRT
jgi:hypothetical protein